MTEFFAALLVFLASHSIPARPAIRGRAVALVGERTYLILYSLLSLALLAWLISAAMRAPVVPLWDASIGAYHLALALMLPACWLLVGGLANPNPLSVSLSRRRFDPARPGLAGLLRHPVMWGFALWALVHLVANGALVPLILFGGFLLFALAGMRILDRRRKRQFGHHWAKLRSGRGWTARQLLTTFGGGTLLYAVLLWLHPVLIGPDPLALLA